MKVCFETFGCRLNRAEALQMEADYLAQGWTLADGHADADLVVVRGCSVTRRAQHECEKLVRHLKAKYPFKKLLVGGCLKSAAEQPALPPPSPSVPTRTARAYLKVQDGCSGNCTFCIVPQFRGKSVSVAFQDVLDRAGRFIEAGYHELVVTGCNLSLYASGGKRLPELLAALAALSSDCRVRLGSVEPGQCAREVVSVMADCENVCRFLHLPIQSGSNGVLTAMRRPYRAQEVEEILREAVAKMPLVALGCDLIAGFPGETEADHLASLGLLKRHPFSSVHVFPYSERPDTLAAGLPNAVPVQIRHARAHQLADLARAARKRFARKFVGRNVRLLIEDEERHSGWTGEYLDCRLAFSTDRRKSLVDAVVTRVSGDRLVAVRRK